MASCLYQGCLADNKIAQFLRKNRMNYAFLARAINYFLEKIHKEGKIAISQLGCLR